VIILVAVVFALAILARATTYTVRFTEAAVRTTFGRATESDVQKDPGLKFKWPDPIQSVTKYDTRARLLQTRSETQQTADSRQLVVEAYCTWRVEDPLRFFQRFSNSGDKASDHYKEAQDVLEGSLRAAMSEVSKYRIDELFTTEVGASKLPELEAKVLATLRAGQQSGNNITDYGISIQTVGVNGIVLPEETTRAVFESMRQDRARLVKELESKGDAEAQAITSTAESNARRIESFATTLAADIRKQGDIEAQRYISQMNEAPELAVFLKEIDFMKQALAKRMTWIVDTSMPGFELLAPNAVRKAADGQVPGVRALMGQPPLSPAGAVAGQADSEKGTTEAEAQGSGAVAGGGR
jgi:membrane protease subunit HflC